MSVNKAKFSINASPASDLGFIATSAQVLTIQLENSTDVSSVRYELYDVTDPESPLASLNAPDLTFAGAVHSKTLNPASGSTTITMVTNGAETHSWLLRATAATDQGEHVFERLIALKNGKPRKTVPAESTQFTARGWADAWCELIDYVTTVVGAGGYTTIKDESSALTQRNTLKFAGASISATDVAGETVVTVSGELRADGTVACSADFNFGSHKGINCSTPTSANDVCNKSYADGLVSGLVVRPSAIAVSTSNVASLSGLATTVDGVALNTDAMRVLLTAQTTASQNGPWLVHSGAWTRPTDFAAGSDAAAAYFFIQQGTAFSDTGWVCTSNTGSAVVGTNNLTFVQFSSAGVIVDDGTTTQKTGNTLAVRTGGIAATQLASNAVTTVKIADANVTPAKLSAANAKGQNQLFNGSAWVFSGVVTKAADLTDASVTVTVTDGNRMVLAAATLTTTRNLTLGITGSPTDKEIITVERYDTTANTYVVKSNAGTTLYTFPVSVKRMASFQYQSASSDWILVSHVAITS